MKRRRISYWSWRPSCNTGTRREFRYHPPLGKPASRQGTSRFSTNSQCASSMLTYRR
jgi:hypothetical protein